MRKRLTLTLIALSMVLGVALAGAVVTTAPAQAVEEDCVWVYNAADFDYSGQVNIVDFGILTAAEGTEYGDPDFNPQCDLIKDGEINQYDVDEFMANYLQGMSLHCFPAE